jgi:hypothetical protein
MLSGGRFHRIRGGWLLGKNIGFTGFVLATLFHFHYLATAQSRQYGAYTTAAADLARLP